ncbi:Hypothetical protein SRAE_2000080400 [Strongyloides ratti]|uniref:F-box domain-containing protein n=1 Tax=Strongyloides ratti TaxID=34506 RepID=A0A090MXW3_STRRB|nr:Hypothetical protein SRAE_2000080400 [Strongyloides ratti]CEF66134.1 Hypothetical protein SRAE_2000080400 [Strongyloides ratti]
MVKKISIIKEHGRIFKLSKTTKKKENSPILKQKIINNNVQSLHTTKDGDKKILPAEIVGNDDFLMSQIIRMIPNSKERANLRLTSKRLNILCNSKLNNKPFQKFLTRENSNGFEWEIFNRKNVHTFVEVVGDTLAIRVPHCNSNVLAYLEKRREMIEFHRFKIKKLEVENIHDGCLNFFKKLDCFENVEMVTFHPVNASTLVLKFFECCSNLKPSIVRFAWLYLSRIIFHPTYGNVDFDKLFPKSVKTIQIDCNLYAIQWLFKLSDHIPNMYFDTLILGDGFYNGLNILSGIREKSLKLMRCFQNVEIKFNEELEYDVTSSLLGNLSLFEIDGGTKLSYDVMITLHKFRYVRFNPLHDELMPEDIDIRLAAYNILNIHHFRVQCDSSWTKPSKFYINPFPKLFEMMRNLTTLELSMRIFRSTDEFKVLVKKLSINIKNVKLSQCEKLKSACIESLADACKQITYLSLEHVKSNAISIKKTISVFKNLKGFSIFFLYHNKNIDSFNDLIKINDTNGVATLNWPELDFLQVVFNSPRVKVKKLIEQIEKNTPRKCGEFIIKYHSKKSFCSSEVLEILIQKSSKYYCKFIGLFSTPVWIKD